MERTIKLKVNQDPTSTALELLEEMKKHPSVSIDAWVLMVAIVAKHNNYSMKEYRYLRAACKLNGQRLSKTGRMQYEKFFETQQSIND